MNSIDSRVMSATKHPVVVEANTVDIRHYFHVLRQHKISIIGLGLIGAILSTMFALRQPDFYSATSTLLVETNQSNLVSIDDVYNSSGQYEYLATQAELLTNRNLVERVIRDLELDTHPRFEGSMLPPDRTQTQESEGGIMATLTRLISSGEGQSSASNDYNPEAFENSKTASLINMVLGRVNVEQVEWTNLIRINVTDSDPQLAAALANSFAENFISTNLEQRVSARQSANDMLSTRLLSLKETLDASEARLQAFMEREGLLDVAGVSTLNEQELDELTTQGIQAAQRRTELEDIYTRIQALQGQPATSLLSLPSVQSNATIQNMLARRVELDRQYAELSDRYGRRHPRMVALQSQRDSINSNLENQVADVVDSIESSYRTAVQVERSIQQEIEASRAEIQSVNRVSFELRELQRAVQTNQELYDLFFTRIRETDETEEIQSSNIMLVDRAVPALGPSGPNRERQIILATVASLALAAMLAFMRDAMDNTIKRSSDIEEKISGELLGIVPLTDIRKSGKVRLANLGFTEERFSTFSEAFRTARTGITLSSLDSKHRIIEVTSSAGGEGKTTTAFNLAAVMSQSGETLIIDADLRKPSIARSLGFDLTVPGLSELMVGDIDPKECIHQYDLGDSVIDVLPSGKKVPNPLEMLSSNSFKNTLRELAQGYDTVVIDTPPVGVVSDALMLAHLSDYVVYVVKAYETPIKQIKAGLSRLEGAGASAVGIILNQVESKKSAYYEDEHYYGQYYGEQT